MENKKYFCSDCGCKEFITKPNRYDIFKSENGKIIFEKSEDIDDKIILFCRDCSKEVKFESEDIIY